MSVRRIAAVASGLALSAGALLVVPSAQAQESDTESGTTPLAEVLLADGDDFDRNSFDYDIVTQAVLAVVEADPQSPVAVLTDGSTPVTAFLPNDFAFKFLVRDLTGQWPGGEQATFQALVDAVGVDTVEQVLLYHVVPGETLDVLDVALSLGTPRTTAAGPELTPRLGLGVQITDQDPDAFDALVVDININEGNAQIAHGVTAVLRPSDL